MQAIRRKALQVRLKTPRNFSSTAPKCQRIASSCKHHPVAMTTPMLDQKQHLQIARRFSSVHIVENDSLDSQTYEKVCEETLDSLCDYFEALVDKAGHIKDSDVSYGNGVLTVNFGKTYGTYVINRQSPNKQIWLSSPTSGPKRYDFMSEGSYWLYKHDNQTLHELLQKEIAGIVKAPVDFYTCAHGKHSS